MFYGLSSLLPLLILGGLVYLIVRAMRNRRADAAPGDAGSARRFFVYVGLYVAFFVSAVGLSGLLGQVLSTAAARSDSDIATTLALVIVGVPVFAALARWTWRRLVADPADRASTGWSLYLNAALITSVALVATSLAALLSGFVDGSGYTGELLAMVLVWTAGWVGHWMAWRLVPPERGPNVHLIGGSAIGLGMLAVGIALALTHAGDMIFDGLCDVVSRGRSDDLGIALVELGVGITVAAVMMIIFFAFARRERH